jgi:plasmid stabilization system protein ParE
MPKPPDIWRVNVTRAADADIEEIHRWTEDRLGLAQADAYATAIASAIKAWRPVHGSVAHADEAISGAGYTRFTSPASEGGLGISSCFA